MVTFELNRVEQGKPNRVRPAAIHAGIKACSGIETEAFGANAATIVGVPEYARRADGRGYNLENEAGVKALSLNGLLSAIHYAFAEHYPLVLGPDDIWLAIALGFANHVNANAEKLRKRFVAHEGKKYIEIRRDGFVKGSPDNDWPGAFAEFSEKIAEHIGADKRDMLVSRFSTTWPIERAASEVVLMDAMQAYFEFGMRTACGIPNVTLLGTGDDWREIRERAQALAEYECEPWVKSLTGVLDHFVSAHAGNADPEFWNSLYKRDGGSGGPYITGAINVFFPYLANCHTMKNTHPNKAALNWKECRGMYGAPSPDSIPLGVSSVPFKWHYYSTTYEMLFLGGFVGATQDEKTLAMRPVIGWGIGGDHAQAN